MTLNSMIGTPIIPDPDPIPQAVYSHSMRFPGVPFTSLLSACAMLMSAYGVQHGIQLDPTFSQGSLTTGNQKADEQFALEYMNFKMMLDGLSRQYGKIVANVQSNGTVLYMKFTCY